MISTERFDAGRHLDVAAGLLAARHKRDRECEPLLPASFGDEAACRGQIAHAFDTAGASGVVAKDGGSIVGFLVASPQNIPATHMLASFFPARGASIGYGHHATAPGREYDAYRSLFGALAEEFVGLGFFDFSINVPAADAATREAWTSLGFGRAMACAIRDVSPTGRAAAGVEVHQAASEDAPVVYALSEELTIHHARSPIFNPYIRESDPASHEFQDSLLSEPQANAHWVAYADGKPLGMNTFMQPFFLSPMTIPNKTIYLFQGIVSEGSRAGGVGTAILSKGVEWAREQGYEHIALHFASANVQGASFWQSSGFRPVEHGLRRRLDERIAWANR